MYTIWIFIVDTRIIIIDKDENSTIFEPDSTEKQQRHLPIFFGLYLPRAHLTPNETLFFRSFFK